MATNISSQHCYSSESITTTPTITMRHKWSIVNFTDLQSSSTDSAFFSPPFSRDKWNLRLRLMNWSQSNGCLIIGLYLNNCENSDTVKAKYSLSLVDVNGSLRFTKNSPGAVTFVARNHLDCAIGVTDEHEIVVRKNAILSFGNLLLGDEDTLQIMCRITFFGGTRSSVKRYLETNLYSEQELADDSLQNDLVSWISATPPDVEIETNDGWILKAHKLLLVSRSSVFRRILSEGNAMGNNRISAIDFDSHVMRSVLQFIYTDKIVDADCLSDKLLRAAHKYNLPKLRKMCENILVHSLTTNNSGILLSLSDSCGAQKLKEKILDFIAFNASRVCESSEWFSQVEKPELCKETLHAIFKKRKV